MGKQIKPEDLKDYVGKKIDSEDWDNGIYIKPLYVGIYSMFCLRIRNNNLDETVYRLNEYPWQEYDEPKPEKMKVTMYKALFYSLTSLSYSTHDIFFLGIDAAKQYALSHGIKCIRLLTEMPIEIEVDE